MPAELVDLDPYRTWLGISEEQRPLSPYQLLGLKPLEADAAKILAGYQRQVAALSRRIGEQERALWEEIRREVDAAYELLTDSEQKAVLDATIRRRARGGEQAAMPAAASATGAVSCRGCGRANAASRRFCGGCGQSLWEKCVQCGTEVSAEEQFCGACGADVVEGLAARQRECDEKLAAAVGLASDHRFDAAISALRTLAAQDDPRLEPWAARALAEIARVDTAKREALAAADRAWQDARRLYDARAFEAAQVALAGIPARLRTPEHEQLLEQAVACREELLALSGDIRAAIEQKNHAQLLPKLERLLVLKPDHAQARKLAEQLRDNLVKSAKSRQAQHKYRETLDALQQIPAFVRTPEVEALAEEAGERECLLLAVRDAPLANRQTLGLADRLCKLAPTDAAAGELRARLAERVKAPPVHPRFAAPAWTPPPARLPVGVPVEWLANVLQPECTNAEIKTTLREHPGQFFTALGLALQGVGLGAMDGDLSPVEKGGVFARLPSLGFGRRQATVAWGLDLADDALKAVKLVRAEKTGSVTIEACEFILHARNLAACDEVQRRETLAGTLQDLAGRAGDTKGQRIIAAMPGHRVLGRSVELPAMPAKKVLDSIQYEARHQFPIPLEELCWNHAILGAPNEGEPRKVLLQAARGAHVRDWLALFKESGWSIDLLQSDALALYNALAFEFGDDAEGGSARSGAVAALDVESESSNFVVWSPGGAWFRTFGLGSESICRELVKQLGLTREQASQVMRDPQRAASFRQFSAAIQPVLTQFASEVDRSLATYARYFPEQPVGCLYGLGSGLLAYGVLQRLRG